MTFDSVYWSPAPSSQGDYGQFPPYQGQGDFSRTLSLNRSNSSALDMRQLTRALSEAREGSGQVREALLSASFRPRLPGLTKIVSKLSKEGSWRKALEVYEVVDELGLRPDTALTNSAISACDKGGRWNKALEIFDRMETLGLHRDAITYSATISALAKGKQWHAALQIFDHMQLNGVEADVVTCCSLINALERGGQWILAEKLFFEMCTVQEEQEQLAALVRAAPNVLPGLGLDHTAARTTTATDTTANKISLDAGARAVGGGSSLIRSHTSPSSVLLALRTVSTEQHTGLPSVDETGATSLSELNLTLSLSAQQGILDALVEEGGAGVQETSKKAQSKDLYHGGDGDTTDLATAFARVTSLSSPSGSFDQPSFDGALSATPSAGAGGGGGGSIGTGSGGQHNVSSGLNHNNNNPFAAVAGRHRTPPRPPPGLTRAGSAASALASEYSYGASITDSEYGSGSFAGMSAAAAPFVSLGSSGGGVRRNASLPPPPPPSRLQRGTFGRAPPANGPVQAAAAAHLRRAMSCFPDFDSETAIGADGSSTTSQSLTEMFNFSHATRVSPNRVCCNALLAAYARAKPPQWQRALHLLQAMWSGGPTLIPDVVSYNTAIKACANAFQLSKALEIYHEMRRNGVYPNATSYNTLIAAAADAGNKEAMQEVGGWLNSSPTEVQATCMNAYVTGLVKVGLWNEALTHFQNMLAPTSPAHPTSATFCTIMAGHMSTGDYPEVQRTFEYMRASGVLPNIVAFNTLLASLAALGNWTASLDVLNATFAAAVEGVHANTATFNTVLAALGKGAVAPNAVQQFPILASQAVQVYQQMQAVRGGAVPDSTTFNTLIGILDATKHSTQVVAVYNLMVGVGLTPDGTAGHKVLSAAISTGQIAKAVHVAQTLQLQNISIDPQQLSGLLAACVNAGSWDLATQLCSAFSNSAQGAATSAAMFNFVLHSAVDGGHFSLAVEIIQIMQSMGVKVDRNFANSIIQSGGNALASSGGALPSAGPTTTTTTFNAASSVGAPSTLQSQKQSTDTTAAHFPNTPQIFSMSPSGAKLSPEPRFPPSSLSSLSSYMDTNFNTTTTNNTNNTNNNNPPKAGVASIDAHHLRRTASSENEGYVGGLIGVDLYDSTIHSTTDGTATIITTATARLNNNTINKRDGNAHSVGAAAGAVAESEENIDKLTLADTNAMLSSMESTGDVAGCIEVFTNMKLIGIEPDCESYHHVVTTLVNGGDGAAAVEMCKKGHEAGVLKHLVGMDVGSVDLRGCCGEVAVAVAVLWLLELKKKEESLENSSFSAVEDENNNSSNNNHEHVKFIFGPPKAQEGKEEEAQCNAVDWHAVRAEVQRVLTTNHSSLYPALSGVASTCIPSHTIKFAVEGPCAILEVQPPPRNTNWSVAAAVGN